MRKHKEKEQTNKLNKTPPKKLKKKTRVETVLHPLLSCIEV